MPPQRRCPVVLHLPAASRCPWQPLPVSLRRCLPQLPARSLQPSKTEPLPPPRLLRLLERQPLPPRQPPQPRVLTKCRVPCLWRRRRPPQPHLWRPLQQTVPPRRPPLLEQSQRQQLPLPLPVRQLLLLPPPSQRRPLGIRPRLWRRPGLAQQESLQLRLLRLQLRLLLPPHRLWKPRPLPLGPQSRLQQQLCLLR